MTLPTICGLIIDEKLELVSQSRSLLIVLPFIVIWQLQREYEIGRSARRKDLKEDIFVLSTSQFTEWTKQRSASVGKGSNVNIIPEPKVVFKEANTKTLSLEFTQSAYVFL